MIFNDTQAFVFPGQGSQSVGMMQSFSNDKDVQNLYQQASEVLGYDLWSLTQDGPDTELNKTQFTQPALLTASFAIWRRWTQENESLPKFLAGHSLGEYTALVASGAVSFPDAVELVSLRGQWMQEAVPQGTGAMAAILGLDESTIITACSDAKLDQIVQAANLNSPGQTVIAGHKEAVERACQILKELGAKRALMLPVSVPSHCDLMKPASEKLKDKLSTIDIKPPKIRVIHNADVAIHTSSDAIKHALVEQLFKPVQWIAIIEKMTQLGVRSVVECGPGKVLSGLVKRIDSSLSISTLNTQEDLHSS